MRFLIRIMGLTCVSLAVLLGLLALAVFVSDPQGETRFVVSFFGGIAVLLLIIGVRWLWRSRTPARSSSSEGYSTRKTRSAKRGVMSRAYEKFRFGSPPPTRKQFEYAISLGVDIRDGMTKWMVSEAIDQAIEIQRADEPASEAQLREIQKYHGVLPRRVTRGEAHRIIEFLEDHTLPCPFCGIEIFASDLACCGCNKSLGAMKIPIKID